MFSSPCYSRLWGSIGRTASYLRRPPEPGVLSGAVAVSLYGPGTQEERQCGLASPTLLVHPAEALAAEPICLLPRSKALPLGPSDTLLTYARPALVVHATCTVHAISSFYSKLYMSEMAQVLRRASRHVRYVFPSVHGTPMPGRSFHLCSAVTIGRSRVVTALEKKRAIRSDKVNSNRFVNSAVVLLEMMKIGREILGACDQPDAIRMFAPVKPFANGKPS